MIVVGLTGLAGSGKSTAARHIVERHGFVRRPFATLLKGMLRYLLHAQGIPADDVERMVEGDMKEVPTSFLGGATPRRAMQTLGTEWGRVLHPDLWVQAWTTSIAGLERIVADDVRFENEVAAIRALGGRVVEVQRPGLVRPADVHVSERGVVADVSVNNDGLPADLAREIDITFALLRLRSASAPLIRAL